MNIKKLLLIPFVFLFFTGCGLLEQEDRTFDGTTLGFQSFSATIDEPTSGGEPETITAQIQLIGPQRSEDLGVIVAADDSSTAVEGIHYEFVNTSPIIIEADSSIANLQVRILDSPLTSTQSGLLYLSIQESSGIEPANNFRTFTVTILGND